MTTRLFLATTLLAASTASGDEPPNPLRESLRQAEFDFARSVKDKDFERFVRFLSPDAIFVGGKSPQRGRDAIARAWKRFFEPGARPLVWHPEIVEVLDSGVMGVTRGPYTMEVPDSAGKWVAVQGTFMSVWRRQPDGSWKIVFDGGSAPCPPAKP